MNDQWKNIRSFDLSKCLSIRSFAETSLNIKWTRNLGTTVRLCVGSYFWTIDDTLNESDRGQLVWFVLETLYANPSTILRHGL